MNEKMQDRALECQSVGTPEVGDGLKTVKLSPWGKVESTNGDFLVDDEGVREILRTFSESAESIPRPLVTSPRLASASACTDLR